mgnify:CR=1 FL=1
MKLLNSPLTLACAKSRFVKEATPLALLSEVNVEKGGDTVREVLNDMTSNVRFLFVAIGRQECRLKNIINVMSSSAS